MERSSLLLLEIELILNSQSLEVLLDDNLRQILTSNHLSFRQKLKLVNDPTKKKLYGSRPEIKAPRIANHKNFPEICGEDCDCLRVIHGMYFSFNIYSFICRIFITINWFFTSLLHQITFKNKQNIENLMKPIPKSILLIFVFYKILYKSTLLLLLLLLKENDNKACSLETSCFF